MSDQRRAGRRTPLEPWRLALGVLVLAMIAAFAATMCYVTSDHGRGTPVLPAIGASVSAH